MTKPSPMQEVANPSALTASPAFAGCALFDLAGQNVSTDLESLFYSFLYAATDGFLPWMDCSMDSASNVKHAQMLEQKKFQSHI